MLIYIATSYIPDDDPAKMPCIVASAHSTLEAAKEELVNGCPKLLDVERKPQPEWTEFTSEYAAAPTRSWGSKHQGYNGGWVHYHIYEWPLDGKAADLQWKGPYGSHKLGTPEEEAERDVRYLKFLAKL